jgi:uncharacterized protein DUF6455
MDEFSIVIVDASDPLLIMGIAWLAILGMLAWGAVAEAWYLVRGRQRALFVHMLERHDLTLADAVASEGYAGLVRAFDRCFNCSEQRPCRHALRWGWLGARDPKCPNAALFAHARESRDTRKTKAAT